MIAVDTNVFIYRLDRREPEKQAMARDLLRSLNADTIETVMPWQVPGELIRQLQSWRDQGEMSQ